MPRKEGKKKEIMLRVRVSLIFLGPTLVTLWPFFHCFFLVLPCFLLVRPGSNVLSCPGLHWGCSARNSAIRSEVESIPAQIRFQEIYCSKFILRFLNNILPTSWYDQSFPKWISPLFKPSSLVHILFYQHRCYSCATSTPQDFQLAILLVCQAKKRLRSLVHDLTPPRRNVLMNPTEWAPYQL